MLLFRSKEHVDRWCEQWKQRREETITLDQGWRLAQAWYGDRLEPEWRRKTPEEVESLWAELGFTSPFWQLPR